MSDSPLLKIARDVVAQTSGLGAEEVAAGVSRGTSVELSQRDGRLEQASESRSMSLGLRLMAEGRYSTHSTSDLRPAPLAAFLTRAVTATRLLEPDPDRALPPSEACGLAQGVDLDLVHAGHGQIMPAQRRQGVAALEERILARRQRAAFRSCTAYWSDSHAESAVVFSNGFEGCSASTSSGYGATITLEDEGGKLPEATTWYASAHPEDLPSLDDVAEEGWRRGLRRRGARPAPSGRYPMLLDRRAVGRVLSVLLGAMAGSALHYGRSCLAGKLGERIAPARFELYDDPLIVRGAGSRLFDGDGFPACKRALVEGGVLRCYLLGQYFARKLQLEPTTSGTSNVVLPPGERSPQRIAADLPRAIRVESFLGGNANSTTGDFSFGIRGTLLEHGQATQSVSEMNIAGNLFELLERYAEPADDVWRFGSFRVPSILFQDVQFSGS